MEEPLGGLASQETISGREVKTPTCLSTPNGNCALTGSMSETLSVGSWKIR